MLERWRTPPPDVTGQGQKGALERARGVRMMGAGALDLWRVPPVKLARYGMNAHAPTLRRLAEPRRTATVLATARHLEGASVDDALTLFDVLVATKLLARAERADDKAKLRELPRLRRAAAKVRDAVAVLMDTPVTGLPGAPVDTEKSEGSEGDAVAAAVSMAQAWERIEWGVMSRELAEALADLEAVRAQPSPDGSSRPELPQGGEGDVDSAWRRQLTVQIFTSLLAEVVPWGATEAGHRERPDRQARLDVLRAGGPAHRAQAPGRVRPERGCVG